MPSSPSRARPSCLPLPYTTLFRSGCWPAWVTPTWRRATCTACREKKSVPCGPRSAIVSRPSPSSATRCPGCRVSLPSSSAPRLRGRDRKSTRLNSSHTVISYAVFSVARPPVMSTPSLHDALPIWLLASLGHAYLAAGDVHGVSRKEVCTLRTAFGDRFQAVALVRDPLPRLQSQLALFERAAASRQRSEEHTSELQSHSDLVCRLLRRAPARHVYPFPTRRSSDLAAGQPGSRLLGGGRRARRVAKRSLYPADRVRRSFPGRRPRPRPAAPAAESACPLRARRGFAAEIGRAHV